jgi:hypothetical protein
MWWLYVSSEQTIGLRERDAATVKTFLVKVFSSEPLSFRRLITVGAYSFSTLFLINLFSHNASDIEFYSELSLPIFIICGITEFLTLSAVLFSLQKMEDRHDIRFLIASTSLGLTLFVVVAFSNFLIVHCLGVLFASMISELSRNQNGMSLGFSAADRRIWGLQLLAMLHAEDRVAIVVPSLGFSMLFLSFSLLVLISRVLCPLIKAPLETILNRFYDSEKIRCRLSRGLRAFRRV